MKLKELYKERILINYYKPILWMDNEMELTKQIKKLEEGFENTFLDSIFEEAKKEALAFVDAKHYGNKF